MRFPLALYAWSKRAMATMKSGAMTIKLRASFSDLMRDAVDGNTEIHTYALQDNVLNKFFETNNTYSFTEKRYSSSKALATFLSILVPGFTLIGILWLGTDLVYKGEMAHGLGHYFEVEIDRQEVQTKLDRIELVWLSIPELAQADLRPHIVRDHIADGSYRSIRHLISRGNIV